MAAPVNPNVMFQKKVTIRIDIAETHVASLGGSLPRLMMAGIVFVLINPSSYWTQFVCSEVIYQLSKVWKEGLLMVIRLMREVKSFAKRAANVIIDAWEACLPSRLNLLKSW